MDNGDEFTSKALKTFIKNMNKQTFNNSLHTLIKWSGREEEPNMYPWRLNAAFGHKQSLHVIVYKITLLQKQFKESRRGT